MVLKYRNFFALTLAISLFILPLFVFGAPDDISLPASNDTVTAPSSRDTITTGGSSLNPLVADDFCELVMALYDVGRKFFIAVATVFVAYAGLSFVFAMGKPERLVRAKSQIFWIGVGIFVFFAAFSLALIGLNTLAELGADNKFNSCF